ncbi:MAG: 2-C-methyl-D-erythritol 4-phosphate cytidylyltransferase [Clostridiaceae bacterium]|jgi:2-C-methyl-D-erythritol 4-phosphate cytidylyltransferase|nr:2-C-methyl-D-erythritol 4-phosphate cytidylyltransferase [Clostridiaceae bacterium]
MGKNSVVIVAAGKGKRMGLDMNKQYVEVHGRPILAMTIQGFEDCGHVDEVVVVANENEIEYCRRNIVEKFGFTKVKALAPGGETRQQSVFNGLGRVSPDCGIVLIHDGARPFILQESIIACINAAGVYGAACAAVPVKDTVKMADTDGFVDRTIDRSGLWQIQTPQAFEYGLIMDAHRKALVAGFDGTDDAMLAERLGCKVKLVKSDYYNIKITTKEDLIFADAICRMRFKAVE